MNIEGVERQLPLFEPPIDPALLVQAAAAGLDLGTVLADLNAPLPHYRFSIMLQKALELTGELKPYRGLACFGTGEEGCRRVALLRSKQEVELLKKVNLAVAFTNIVQHAGSRTVVLPFGPCLSGRIPVLKSQDIVNEAHTRGRRPLVASPGGLSPPRGDRLIGGGDAGEIGAVRGRIVVLRARLAGEEQAVVHRRGQRGYDVSYDWRGPWEQNLCIMTNVQR